MGKSDKKGRSDSGWNRTFATGRNAEKELRSIYNAISGYLTVIDRNYRIISCNATVEEDYGKDLIGKICYEVYQGRDKTCPDCAVRKTLETGKPAFTFQPATPVSKPVEIYSYPIFDDEGVITGVVEHGLDITEKLRVEESLRESENFLQTIIETEPECVKLLGADGTLLKMNRSGLDMIKADSLEQVAGQSIHPLIDPAHRQAFVALTDEVFQGKSGTLEFVMVDMESGRHWMETHAVPLRNQKGEIIALLGITREITKQKQALEALRESEEHFRSVAQTASDAIISIDRSANVILWNKAAETMFGFSADEAIGKPLPLIMPERLRETHRKGMKRFLSSGESKIIGKSYEGMGLGKDGTEFPIEISLANWEQEGQVFYTGIIRDITERKRMEEELLKAQKLESLGVLAGGLAHDFNNLLTGILGNISLAKLQAKPGDDIFKNLEEGEKASLRAKGLTQQLLTFSKGGAPIKKILSVVGVIKEAANFAVRGSNVRCDFSISDGIWSTEADEGQISQVINNLIINADQAMPEGGIVKIGLENVVIGVEDSVLLQEGKYIKISIEDQGIGIPQEYLQKIFDPFFTTKQTGSGLGLATAFSIIKRHGGVMTVDSEVGVGTTFTIYLPAFQEEALENEEAEGEPVLGQGRILIMDDEKIIRDVAGKMLRSMGYEVEFARDGQEAIELYKKASEAGEPFDSVILDLTIPGGMGGKNTIRGLLEIDSEVKGIVSSGYSDDPVMTDFRKYGFKGVVAKPFQIKDLTGTLHKVITGLDE